MRVAIVTDLYDPASLPERLPRGARLTRAPYTGSFVYEQAAALARAGVEVELLVPARYFFSLRRPLSAWRELRSLGVVTRPGEVPRRYAFWPCRGALCAPPLDALAVRGEARALGRLLDAGERPDLVHAHFAFPAGCAAARAARPRRLPYVITVHESYFGRVARRVGTRRAVRRALAGAARVVAPSAFQRGRILARMPEIESKLAVVPNGVDAARFAPRASVRGGPPAQLSFVGNLVGVKDLPALLTAAAALKEAGLSFEFSIAGDGPLRGRLEEQARRKELPVRFLGALKRDGVARLLREETDILVLASRTETFGIVLVEALASGVPVVATRCGGPEDIVTDEVGRLVPVGDPDALARAIREVWERRDGFPPERLARYARERFSHDRIAAQLAALYGEVLRGRS